METNNLGAIAGSYDELQSLPNIRAARTAFSLQTPSALSLVRTVFQAAEIALWNLVDLTQRATSDLGAGRTDKAIEKLAWARGFHNVLGCLGTIPQRTQLIYEPYVTSGMLRLADSPALATYLEVIQAFDQTLLEQISAGSFSAKSLIADGSATESGCRLLQFVRIISHESTLWERNLATIPIPHSVDYAVLIAPAFLREAVFGRSLIGDTYFTQFRGLHQIPEIICLELNDSLATSIRALKTEHYALAAELLDDCLILFEGILISLGPIIDNLTTSDYHRIRENLGPTSGSHSISIHFELFRDLYNQLGEQVVSHVLEHSSAKTMTGTVQEALSRLDQSRLEADHTWALHLIVTQSLRLRAMIDAWRERHMHLPRNNLGGTATRSLAGAPDAIRTVRQMYQHARQADPLAPLATARHQAKNYEETAKGPLSRYLADSTSADSYLLGLTGTITQSRFKDVQERTGVFTEKSSFVPPPPREL